jgi:dTDP-4-dehydrorhamnose reductase
MNFLVTGGAGFIGSHLCERLLSDGHAVWVLDDLNSFYDPALKRRNVAEIQALRKPFVFIQGDVADRPCVEQLFRAVPFDQVIHLAARAGVRPSLQEPALYQRVNVEGTANILEAARASGVAKVILASSSSVYGVNSKVPFAETDPVFAPISPYAASKLACEALGHVFHHVYGMDIVMLRFFTVYGPRQRPDLAIHKFARRMATVPARAITPTSRTSWMESWLASARPSDTKSSIWAGPSRSGYRIWWSCWRRPWGKRQWWSESPTSLAMSPGRGRTFPNRANSLDTNPKSGLKRAFRSSWIGFAAPGSRPKRF